MSKLIISLDRMSMAKALELAEQAQGMVWGFKVNDLLLHYGAEIVYKLKKFGNVMADPKLHDIPNTVHNAIRVLRSAGADLITVHASANYQPKEKEAEHLAAISVLTSLDDPSCADIYNSETVRDQVWKLSELISEKGYTQMVCSSHEIDIAKKYGFKSICPGIRPNWYLNETKDQKRIMTPSQAIAAEADLLVIGRPLILAENFVEAVLKTKEEMGEQI